jgi:UDP-N-acetylmuramoyl-L-alanyl-D-glutamate--2,6-diaminopimelate ligase
MQTGVSVHIGRGVIKLGELVKGLPDVAISGNADIDIEGIEYDSRRVKRGYLFIAVKGFKVDGFDFVDDAISRGAIAVMGERDKCESAGNYIRVTDVRRAMSDVAARFYGFPGMRLKVYGITGTNGKTTTCHLLKKILEARGRKVGLITSSSYETGAEVYAADRTTPESLDTQRLLYEMTKNGCTHAVVEVSSHALVLHRVDNITFQVAIYTNLTRDHLDFHKKMDKYLQAKAMLLSKLDESFSFAVINIDQPEFRDLMRDVRSSRMSYSLNDSSADVYCRDYSIGPDKTDFELNTPMGSRMVNLRLPGKFNLINAIGAAAGGLASGVDIDHIVAGLNDALPVPGRFNHIDAGQPFAVYIDYAHTPDAIERLCEAAREISAGKLLLLFGCGGDRDKGKRPMMGKAATQFAEFVVVTSDNPRSEAPEAIIKDIKPGLTGKTYEILPDRKQAIAAILRKAQAGDVVLIAGKGAENYQEIKGVRHPFDDAAETRAVLASMGYNKSSEGI